MQAAGSRSKISCTAAIPVPEGRSRSIRVNVWPVLREAMHCIGAAGSGPDKLHIGVQSDQERNTFAEQRIVVYSENTDLAFVHHFDGRKRWALGLDRNTYARIPMHGYPSLPPSSNAPSTCSKYLCQPPKRSQYVKPASRLNSHLFNYLRSKPPGTSA